MLHIRSTNTKAYPLESCVLIGTHPPLPYWQLASTMEQSWSTTSETSTTNLSTSQPWEPKSILTQYGRSDGILTSTKSSTFTRYHQTAESWTGVSWKTSSSLRKCSDLSWRAKRKRRARLLAWHVDYASISANLITSPSLLALKRERSINVR